MSRIYTKYGDYGQTTLRGCGEIFKWDERVETLGAIDELNAAIGMSVALLNTTESSRLKLVVERLLAIQNMLFSIGAVCAWWVAAPVGWKDLSPNKKDSEAPPSDSIKEWGWSSLEEWINEFQDKLPPLKNFILPGGGQAAASLHFARAVCRRAERRVWALVDYAQRHFEIEYCGDLNGVTNSGTYLNRLSDFLFVCARWVAHVEDRVETIWSKDQ